MDDASEKAKSVLEPFLKSKLTEYDDFLKAQLTFNIEMVKLAKEDVETKTTYIQTLIIYHATTPIEIVTQPTCEDVIDHWLEIININVENMVNNGSVSNKCAEIIFIV